VKKHGFQRIQGKIPLNYAHVTLLSPKIYKHVYFREPVSNAAASTLKPALQTQGFIINCLELPKAKNSSLTV
jgi:hypothetical protein